MALINEDSFGKKICEILKLDSHKIKTITIKIQPDDIVQITTEQILFVDEGKEILNMLKYYHLELNKDEQNKT